MTNKLFATIKQNTLSAFIGFEKIYVGNVEALRQKLYPWMLSHGYEVTETMSLAELIDVLVGEMLARYSIIDKIFKVEDSDARIQGNTAYLVNGASLDDDKTLIVRDI